VPSISPFSIRSGVSWRSTTHTVTGDPQGGKRAEVGADSATFCRGDRDPRYGFGAKTIQATLGHRDVKPKIRYVAAGVDTVRVAVAKVGRITTPLPPDAALAFPIQTFPP
jgi:hypothetical protein